MNEVIVGSEPPPEPKKPNLPWLLALALVLGGGALGYLLGASAASSPVEAEPTGSVASTEIVEDTDGLLIPGYRGLLAVLLFAGSRSELAVWGPFATEPDRMVLGAELGNTVDLNSTRVWAAGRSESGADSFLHLGSVRQPVPLEPYRDGITSFAWHLTEPGAIAWTERADGRTRLVSASPAVVRNPTGNARPDAESREIGGLLDGTVLLGFAEDGFVLEERGNLMTVDDQGILVGRTSGWAFAAASPAGPLLVHDGDEFAWTDSRLQEFVPAGFVPRGVAFSPDREQVAYLERDATGTFLRIAPVGGPVEQSWEVGGFEESLPLAVPMDWTFDGFILMPSETMGRSYVMALDTKSGTISEFGIDGRIVRLWGFRGSDG